jgi:uncharacterized protein YecT (DUF1311 family)
MSMTGARLPDDPSTPTLGAMKTEFLALIIAVLPVAAHSAPDEQVIEAMAKQTGFSPKEIRESYNACDSGVTLTMKICGAYRLTEQDLRLNRVYKQVAAKADRDLKESLLKAQRSWLSYRDSQCPLEGRWGADGGTAEGLYVLSCKLDLTKQQADRLEAMVRE